MTGVTRWSDGAEMVTLDYSRLTSVLWWARDGFDAVEAWQAQRGPKSATPGRSVFVAGSGRARRRPVGTDALPLFVTLVCVARAELLQGEVQVSWQTRVKKADRSSNVGDL